MIDSKTCANKNHNDKYDYIDDDDRPEDWSGPEHQTISTPAESTHMFEFVRFYYEEHENVSCNPMTTDRASFNRQKNDPKYQPHKMAHLVFADTRANTQKTKRANFLPLL